MVVGGSQQEIVNLGFVLLCTRQQGVPVLFSKELMLPDGFDPVSPSFTLYNNPASAKDPDFWKIVFIFRSALKTQTFCFPVTFGSAHVTARRNNITKMSDVCADR
ncbi:unnamed protein product [Schistosoma mattheei]|uniref:Uncharacterized protein n=1 Tax=Schistosoma mattheei TaxID=31246 RepID=A0A183PLQ9_9TREM|nr:unnamed protein product [Schistosoma mattheei]